MSIASAMIVAGLAFCASVRGSHEDDLLAKLQSADVAEIADAIRALDDELLRNDGIVGQLVVLLNDERIIRRHIMGSDTVRDDAWFKLLILEPTSVPSIAARLPDLASNRALGLALEAIARVGKPDGDLHQKVLPYCRHDDVFVRSRAISALGAVADHSPETVAQFGVFLDDSEPVVRANVLDCLRDRAAHVSSLIPAIGKLLDDESDFYIAISNDLLKSEKLPGRVARLLAAIGPDASETLPRLRQLTDPEFDANVRIWSATAICAISNDPPREMLDLLGQLLIEEMDDEYADNDAPEAIIQLGLRASPLLDRLELAKRHRSSAVRWGVAEAFFAVDPGSAVDRALPMISDDDELVVEAVIQALSMRHIREPRVIEAYIRTLDRHDGIFDLPAGAAVEALTELGAAARTAVPALKSLADDPEISNSLREDVNRAIAAIGDSSDDSPGASQ